MNHITDKQFLVLDKKIQKIFIDWWKIEEGDFICLVDEERECLVARVEREWRGELIDCWYYDYDSDKLISFDKTPCEGEYTVIPLFRLDQLLKFIRTKYPNVGINNYLPINCCLRVWNIKLFKGMEQFEPDIEIMEEGLLQTVWRAAIKAIEISLEV
jgi:hypothetical protein